MAETYNRYWEKVMAFATQEAGKKNVASALAEYLSLVGQEESQIDDIGWLRFFEWLVWDYRNLRTEESLFSRFLKTCSTDDTSLNPMDIDVLTEWQDTPLTLVLVKEVLEREQCLVQHLFSGEQFCAYKWAPDIAPDNMYMGRWLPLRKGIFAASPSVCHVPDDLYVFLHKYIEQAYRRYPGRIQGFIRDYGACFPIWLSEIAASHHGKSSLLFEVMGFVGVLHMLRRLPGIRLKPNAVINLHGPVCLEWMHEGQLGAELLLDEDEMLVMADDAQILRKFRAFLLCLMDDVVELAEEYYVESQLRPE